MVLAVVGCLVPSLALPASASTYSLSVAPSRSVITVGDCLSFSGTVLQSGRPARGIVVGVEDPIREQCIGTAATTDSNGRFTYVVESMCPARYNSKAGSFSFKFRAQDAVATSRVTVNLRQAGGYDELKVINRGTRTYQVRLVANGSDRGTYSIQPGQTKTIWTESRLASSSMRAYVLNSSGTSLWNATFSDSPYSSMGYSSMLNPRYANYSVNSSNTIDGAQRSFSFTGIARTVYSTVANREFTVGKARVRVDNRVEHGVNVGGQAEALAPGCSTFLGLKGTCSVSCDAAVGLELCAGWGAGWAIGPGKIGCTANCCVEVASVRCQVATLGIQADATYKP